MNRSGVNTFGLMTCATPSIPSILSRALSKTLHAEDFPLPLGPTIISPWWMHEIWYSWRICKQSDHKDFYCVLNTADLKCLLTKQQPHDWASRKICQNQRLNEISKKQFCNRLASFCEGLDIINRTNRETRQGKWQKQLHSESLELNLMPEEKFWITVTSSSCESALEDRSMHLKKQAEYIKTSIR